MQRGMLSELNRHPEIGGHYTQFSPRASLLSGRDRAQISLINDPGAASAPARTQRCVLVSFRARPQLVSRMNIALLRQPNAEVVVTLPGARAKAAAVDAQDGRERPDAALGPGQVELEMLVVGIGVLDAGLKLDRWRNDRTFLSVRWAVICKK